MNLSGQIKICVLFLLFLLAGACAKMATPSGGPRDRTPPVVLGTIPEANSINFKGKRIIITFDEYVTLDNVNENLIVSPPLQTRPKVWLRGKSVIVDLQEDLKEDFTYIFYFQNAIKDLNEGNILEGYQYVVATGPVLDSLTVTGNVFYADNLETPEKIFVLMHKNAADTAVQKSLPDYLGMVDASGYFNISNIAPGSYRLYALKDADNNKRYNLDDEEFAFIDDLIEVSADASRVSVVEDTEVASEQIIETPKKQVNVADTTVMMGEHKLYMFKKEPEARYLRSSQRKSKTQLEFALSLPPEAAPFEFSISGAAKESFIAEQNITRDTLTVWLIDSILIEENPLKGEIRYPFTDSTGMIIMKTDTVNLRYVEARAPRNVTEKAVEPLVIRTDFPTGGGKPGQKFMLRSATPLIEPDITLMKLFKMADDTTQVPFLLRRDSLTATKYIVETELLPESRYFFVADSGAFRDVYNLCSDSIGMMISVKALDSYGSLAFNIKNVEGAIIVQLLDKTEKLIMEKSMTGEGKVDFPLLDPGTYRAKIIFDADNNGRWTSGDFDKGRQPEQVTYYPNEVEVKAKFDIEQDWDAGIKNEKDQKLKAAIKK